MLSLVPLLAFIRLSDDIPQLDRVFATCRQNLPVRAERDGADVPPQGRRPFPRLHVPQLELIDTPGSQGPPVRAERHARAVCMAGEGGGLLAGLRVPQLDRLVQAS